MNLGKVLSSIQALRSSRRKGFAVLIDPDKIGLNEVGRLAASSEDAGVDYLLVGGSLLMGTELDRCIREVKAACSLPVVLFPGSPAQLSAEADALLYLSLISGRNPELLIGAHVVSAPAVRASGLEIISTGYMIIDGGVPTTVSYMSHSHPIPSDKEDIALCTAMAGEMQGKHVLYMDAGSGARRPVSTEMINRVASGTEIPLLVGGGIRDAETAFLAAQAGADVIVVGNAIETDPSLIREMTLAVHQVKMHA